LREVERHRGTDVHYSAPTESLAPRPGHGWMFIHPLVLGSGRRLFCDGSPYAILRLVDTKTTTTGVIIATYQPTEPTAVTTA
jgi:hypothetical protein